MNDLNARLDPHVELARLMERVREAVHGPSESESVTSTEPARAWLPTDQTTEPEAFEAALASQAEFNRHILGMVNGMFEHLRHLEESLSRFDRFLARQDGKVDFDKSTAPRKDDGDWKGGL
jgi:hypothetical protein